MSVAFINRLIRNVVVEVTEKWRLVSAQNLPCGGCVFLFLE